MLVLAQLHVWPGIVIVLYASILIGFFLLMHMRTIARHKVYQKQKAVSTNFPSCSHLLPTKQKKTKKKLVHNNYAIL